MQTAPNPSLLDGLTPEQVAAFKRTAINTIIDTGTRLQMDHVAIATAVIFLHRFYATKSLVRNDPFLMSVACLYLGGKVEDSPKSVRDVLMASCELRFRDAARRLALERDLYERLREQVFVAERTLLYALDFQFNVQQPYAPCLSMLNSEPLKSYREALAARDARKAHSLAQFAINFINDSLKTEACLHYSGPQIAAACIWLSMKLLKEDSHIYSTQGKLWWVAVGVTEEHLEGVEALLQQVYSRSLYSIYTDKSLVLQSAVMLSSQQLQLHAMAKVAAEEQQRGTDNAPANGMPPPSARGAALQQQAVALPSAVAAASHDSWLTVGAPAAAGSVAPAAPSLVAPPAAPVPVAAEPATDDAVEDYDDLFANLV